MDMLTFAIDWNNKTPIYEQLYSFIKSEIQTGRLPHGTKLPSKRKLAAYLKVSINTIQAAYYQLIEEGYVVSLEKKGFYVSKIDNLMKLDTQKLSGEINYDRSQPKVLYDFSYHGVDLQSYPFIIWRKLTKEVINEYDKELLQLGNSQGLAGLRSSIAEYLHQSRGVQCSPDQIIISSGTEFLFQILIQLFPKESVYAIENPGYEKLNLLFSSNHATFKALAIDEEGMIPDEIRRSNANILCITPSHQFPSGGIMPINRRIQIINWANEADHRYIIEDDYDSEFKYSGKPIPALQGLDTNEKVIYMGAFSKSLSPAIRISYMVLPVHLIKKYLENLSFIICPVPIIDQKVLCRFIQEGYFERHLNKMRNIYKRKRELIVRSIKEFNCRMEVLGADAGLHLLLKVNNGMSEDQLVAFALQNKIKVYGISKYYLDKSHINKCPTIVIGYAMMTETELYEAVRALYNAWF